MTAAPPESTPPDQYGGRAAESNGGKDAPWRRNFRLLLSGSVFSQLGTLSAAAANPLLALALTRSPIVAGWVAAASTLPGLLLHLPVGLIVDRFDRWRIMRVSQLIRVVNSTVLVIGLCTISEAWALLVLSAVIDGSCAVFFRTAELAAVRFVVPDGEAENAMGKSEARHHLALVLGRPVGGILFTAGQALPYVLDAFTSLFSVLSLHCLKKRLKPQAEARPESRHEKRFELSREEVLQAFKGGFLWVSRDRFLSVSLGACAIANTGFQIVILLLVVEAQREGISGSLIGTMLATSGFAGFLGAITAPRAVWRLTPERTVRFCVVSWIPFLVAVALLDDPLIGMCAWGACSFFGAYINVALAMYQARVIPLEFLGRVEGVSQFLTTGAVTLGALAGGYVIAVLGTRPTAALVTAAFAVIGTAVLALVRVSKPPRDENPPEERSSAADELLAGEPATDEQLADERVSVASMAGLAGRDA